MAPTQKEYEKTFAEQQDKLRRMAFLFLHDDAAVDDALQETFIRGLASLHTFRAESRFDVWLYSVALNVCRQAYRKARLEAKAAHRERSSAGRGPITSLLRREDATRL